MLELPHVLLGAAIAVKFQNPVIAIPVSFASHFVLDLLPHWNPHINREVEKFGKPARKSVAIILVDSTLALIIGTTIAFTKGTDTLLFLTILASCFAAVLPDVVEAPYYFMGKKTFVIEKWISWQKSIQNDVAPIPGLASQLAIIVASLWWIFN